MAIGEANGNSSTFTIKQLSATQTDCVESTKEAQELPEAQPRAILAS